MKLILESSLSRLYKAGKDHDCGTMSAFREKDENGKTLTRAENVKAHNKLGKELRDAGYSVTKVIGGYQYGGENEVSKELSWFVCDKNDKGDLKKVLTQKGTEYDQECVFMAPKGAKPYLIWTRKGSSHGVGEETDTSKSKTWGKKNPDSNAFTMVGGRKFADNIDIDTFKNRNMNENSKKYTRDFDTVFESHFSRYTAGYFSKGDIVKIDSKILNDEHVKNMPEEMQMRLKDMVEASETDNALIMVSNIALNPFMSDNYEPASITLAYSSGGGSHYGETTVNGVLGKYLTIVTGVDAIVPKSAIRKVKETERVPVDMDKAKEEFGKGFSTDVRQEKQKEDK